MDFHRAGRLAEAGTCYETALRTAPRNSDALHLLGLLVAAQGQVQRGVELIRQSVKIQPRFAAALFNLGTLLHKQNRFPEAVAALERAVILQPKFPEAHSNLGNALASLGRHDAAAAALRKAIAAKRDYAEAHRNLGLVYQMQGKLDEAVAALRQAVAVKPDYANAYCDLGIVLQTQRKFADSIAALGRAVVLNPQDVLAWRHLGASLRDLEKFDEAKAAYRQAITLLPNCAELLIQGKIPEAISALQLVASVTTRPRRSGHAPAVESASVRKQTTTVEIGEFRIGFTFSIIVLTGPASVTICAPAFFQFATGANEAEALHQLDAAISRKARATAQTTANAPSGDSSNRPKIILAHTLAEPATLFYEFARHLEEAHYYPEALEWLREARRLGLESKHFLFNHGRLSAFLGHLDEAALVHQQASAACVSEAASSPEFGSAELPDYLRHRKSIGRLTDLFREASALVSPEHRQPPDQVRTEEVEPLSPEPATKGVATMLLQIEAHNLLAEDLVNFYGDFAGARQVYLRRNRIQRECLDACHLEHVDTLFLGQDWVRNMGHIAFLGPMIKLQELGLAPWRHIVVLAPERRIANRALLDCWRKYLTVVTDPSLIDRLEPLATACGFRFSTLFPFAGREPLYTSDIGGALEEQWSLSGRPPLLALSEEQGEAGWTALATHGVNRADWFVCLHVRETGFHGRSDHTPRNATIDSYFPAIETITRRGGWVIRLGDPSMSRLPAMARVIDYAHSDLKSPAMDVFLCAKCRCYVGTNSGLGHVPYTFGTPTVMTNWITAGGLPPFPRNGIYLPKLIFSTAEQRLLSFREMLGPEWRASSCTTEKLADHDAHFVDNTSEEINEIVLEMLVRIEGQWPPVPAGNDLQGKFAALVPGVSPQGVTRLGSGFLHRYLALL